MQNRQSDPLRVSISVSFTRREAAAFKRLGNRYGSRSDQIRDCLDMEKVRQKIAEAERLAGNSDGQRESQ